MSSTIHRAAPGSGSGAAPSTPRADGPGPDALAHARAVMALLFDAPEARPFRTEWWTGNTDAGAPGAGLVVRVRRPGALRRMLLPPSELSLVEAILSGDVELDGDIEPAMALGDAIAARVRRPRTLAALLRHLLALPRAGDTDVTGARAARTVGQAGRRHEARRDRAAIQYHYDVGNDFYALWLDERMVYSCAYFRRPEFTLDQAQVAKLDHVCRKLRLRPGERFLDVGCGWGALLIHAARHYGVDATGITLSEQQAALARERIAAAGLADRCRVELRDYRDVRETYDKVASVGMVEHVGEQNLPVYFAAVHRALAPGGLFLNHGIVSVSGARPRTWKDRVEGRLWKRDVFIDQYVFPDGKLAPLAPVIAAAEGAGFETRDVESLREHYTRTLREWIARLEAHRDAAVVLAGDRTFRTWRLYMTGSAVAFARGNINVVQTLLARPRDGVSGLPPTREDLYA